MENNNHKNTATLIHLSALTQYFIPFGNFIFPILIWNSTKEKSDYLDKQGKQVINFQLSLFVYALVLCLIAIPTLLVTIFSNVSINEIINHDSFYFENFNIENITGAIIVAITAIVILIVMKIAEFLLIILASLKASNGEDYKYPLTISFIK